MRTKTVSVLLFVYVLMASLSAHTQNPQWKGRIEDEGGVKVVVNPVYEIYKIQNQKLEPDKRGDLISGLNHETKPMPQANGDRG